MSEKIYINIDGKRIEAKGEKLDYILQAQAEALEAQKLFEAETTAKAQAKESAMAKLRKLGLTDDEIAGLIS
jgi:type VI protein secretion system component Hcp